MNLVVLTELFGSGSLITNKIVLGMGDFLWKGYEGCISSDLAQFNVLYRVQLCFIKTEYNRYRGPSVSYIDLLF